MAYNREIDWLRTTFFSNKGTTQHYSSPFPTKKKTKKASFVGKGMEKVVRSQSTSRLYAINVSCKHHGLFYIYLTVEAAFSQAIPDFFPPEIVTSSRRVMVQVIDSEPNSPNTTIRLHHRICSHSEIYETDNSPSHIMAHLCPGVLYIPSCSYHREMMPCAACQCHAHISCMQLLSGAISTGFANCSKCGDRL